MVYSYTTADLVQSEIRATTAFASTTIPSLSDVTTWITEESAQINNDIGYNVGQTQYDEYRNYNEDDIFFTKVAPVISVSTLLYNTTTIGSTGYSTGWQEKTENTDFFIELERGEIKPIFSNWQPKDGDRNIRLIYDAGYATTPLDIQKLATKMVALRILNTLIQNNVNERNDGGSISVGSINIVEPDSYGVSSYTKLQEDIRTLKEDVSMNFGVHRYGSY